MAEWIILFAAGLSSLISCAWLALAMPAHQKQVYGRAFSSQQTESNLRLLGGLGLTGSGILCFLADRPSMAVLVWIMLMALSATLIALTLTWKPAFLKIVCAGPARKPEFTDNDRR